MTPQDSDYRITLSPWFSDQLITWAIQPALAAVPTNRLLCILLQAAIPSLFFFPSFTEPTTQPHHAHADIRPYLADIPNQVKLSIESEFLHHLDRAT